MENVTAGMSAKSVRLSAVALSAAVMAVIWVVIDTYTFWFVPAVLVSAVTSLVMLIAQFMDFKAGIVFKGKPNGTDTQI